MDSGPVVSLVPVSNGDVGVARDLIFRLQHVFHHRQDDIGRFVIVTRAFDYAVSDNEDALVRVGIVGGGDGVERGAKTRRRFRIRGHNTEAVSQRIVEWLIIGWRLRDDIMQWEWAANGFGGVGV